jgi:hypothetical protein
MAHQIPMLDMPAAWYGIDPIHILPRHWNPAWRTMIRAGLDASHPEESAAPKRWSDRWRIRTLTPAEWGLLGFSRGRTQPCFRMPGGATISLF